MEETVFMAFLLQTFLPLDTVTQEGRRKRGEDYEYNRSNQRASEYTPV